MSALELPSRIPPHNLDAERAVLGAILLEGREALPRVVEALKESNFYTEAHRAIYRSMLTLFDHGEPVDLLTLQEDLRRTDQLSLVGGPAALALLVETGSVAAYLNSYTAIVRDMAVLRELIQTATHIIGQAFEAKEDVQALVDDAERRIFGLAEADASERMGAEQAQPVADEIGALGRHAIDPRTAYRGHGQEREAYHTGGQSRVSTLLYLRPDRGLAVVLLTNLEGIGPALLELGRQIADLAGH